MTTSGLDTRGYVLEVYQDPEDESWVAEVPDLPGCLAAGDTPAEALELVGDAIDAWIDAAQADGRPVPAARAVEDEHSGRFVLRLQKSLHRRLAVAARRDGVSLNSFCATALAEAVGLANLRAVAVGQFWARPADWLTVGAVESVVHQFHDAKPTAGSGNVVTIVRGEIPAYKTISH